MFLEFLVHLISLDFGWLLSFLAGNIAAAFMLLAVIFFFLEGKKLLYGFLVLGFLIMVWQDFEFYTGAIVFGTGFLGLYFITKFVVLSFAESSSLLKNKLILVEEVQFLVAFVLVNFIFR